MSFGLTPTGFIPKRLSDILAEAETKLAAITDPKSGQTLQPDFDSDDPAMQIVKVPLDGLGAAWEVFQAIADQYDPNNAGGPLLSSLVQLNGITRDDGTPSTVALQLSGTPTTVIPAGQLVSDINSTTLWATDEEVVLDGGGLGNTTASSQENGPFEAAIGTVTQILTSVSGWDAVTNTASSLLGEPVERDEDLRVRRDQSTLAPSVTPAEALWANLRNLDGVSFVRVLSNRSLTTDGNGIPGKSIAAVIVGGDDIEIARTLLARTSDAADWYGNTTVTLYDLQGEPYAISWIRPADLDIYVEVDITVTNGGTWPSNGGQLIGEAIVAYSVGGAPSLGVNDGFREIGFLPGSDIDTSRLYTPINSIPGHRITGLRVGTTVSPTATATVVVAFDEQSRFDVSRIVVNVS